MRSPRTDYPGAWKWGAVYLPGSGSASGSWATGSAIFDLVPRRRGSDSERVNHWPIYQHLRGTITQDSQPGWAPTCVVHSPHGCRFDDVVHRQQIGIIMAWITYMWRAVYQHVTHPGVPRRPHPRKNSCIIPKAAPHRQVERKMALAK